MSSGFAHIIVIALAIAAYVVLTVTGHDGNPVFVFVGGQAIGAGIQAVTNSNENLPAKIIPAPDRSTIK